MDWSFVAADMRSSSISQASVEGGDTECRGAGICDGDKTLQIVGEAGEPR